LKKGTHVPSNRKTKMVTRGWARLDPQEPVFKICPGQKGPCRRNQAKEKRTTKEKLTLGGQKSTGEGTKATSFRGGKRFTRDGGGKVPGLVQRSLYNRMYIKREKNIKPDRPGPGGGRHYCLEKPKTKKHKSSIADLVRKNFRKTNSVQGERLKKGNFGENLALAFWV